jgi:hypothetical protein
MTSAQARNLTEASPVIRVAIVCEPEPRPLQGIEHGYALLGFVGPGPEWRIERFRHRFSPIMRRGKKK